MTATTEEKIFTVEVTDSEACLLLAALLNLERDQVRLAKKAQNEGRLKQAHARLETGKRILALSERIEEASK